MAAVKLRATAAMWAGMGADQFVVDVSDNADGSINWTQNLVEKCRLAPG